MPLNIAERQARREARARPWCQGSPSSTRVPKSEGTNAPAPSRGRTLDRTGARPWSQDRHERHAFARSVTKALIQRKITRMLLQATAEHAFKRPAEVPAHPSASGRIRPTSQKHKADTRPPFRCGASSPKKRAEVPVKPKRKTEARPSPRSAAPAARKRRAEVPAKSAHSSGEGMDARPPFRSGVTPLKTRAEVPAKSHHRPAESQNSSRQRSDSNSSLPDINFAGYLPEVLEPPTRKAKTPKYSRPMSRPKRQRRGVDSTLVALPEVKGAGSFVVPPVRMVNDSSLSVTCMPKRKRSDSNSYPPDINFVGYLPEVLEPPPRKAKTPKYSRPMSRPKRQNAELDPTEWPNKMSAWDFYHAVYHPEPMFSLSFQLHSGRDDRCP